MARKQQERKDMPGQKNPGKTEAPGRDQRNTDTSRQSDLDSGTGDEQNAGNTNRPDSSRQDRQENTRQGNTERDLGNRSSEEEPVQENSDRT